ncbi:MAG: 2-oxoacid:acceptor oxidoreductase family protein [Clostridiales bacterium]|nr:2-oxoacid:acceptor oxidoreductase family protein [Clostridiales bacterium]
MSTQKIIIAGFGGQGVLLIGQLLAYAAMMEGKEVTWMPSYGPEMRGGTANCTVIVSDKKIASPLVTQATAVAAMNGPSLEKFKDLIVPGGDLFVNASIITGGVEKEGAKIHNVDCMGLAAELQNTKVANMVMLGAIYQVTGVVSESSIKAAMEKTFTGGKAKLVDLNMKALYAWKG